VIREDDELQARARRGPRDVGLVAVAVGPRGVDVIRAGDRARRQVGPRRRVEPLGRARNDARKNDDGDRKRCDRQPAC